MRKREIEALLKGRVIGVEVEGEAPLVGCPLLLKSVTLKYVDKNGEKRSVKIESHPDLDSHIRLDPLT